VNQVKELGLVLQCISLEPEGHF